MRVGTPVRRNERLFPPARSGLLTRQTYGLRRPFLRDRAFMDDFAADILKALRATLGDSASITCSRSSSMPRSPFPRALSIDYRLARGVLRMGQRDAKEGERPSRAPKARDGGGSCARV